MQAAKPKFSIPQPEQSAFAQAFSRTGSRPLRPTPITLPPQSPIDETRGPRVTPLVLPPSPMPSGMGSHESRLGRPASPSVPEPPRLLGTRTRDPGLPPLPSRALTNSPLVITPQPQSPPRWLAIHNQDSVLLKKYRIAILRSIPQWFFQAFPAKLLGSIKAEDIAELHASIEDVVHSQEELSQAFPSSSQLHCKIAMIQAHFFTLQKRHLPETKTSNHASFVCDLIACIYRPSLAEIKRALQSLLFHAHATWKPLLQEMLREGEIYERDVSWLSPMISPDRQTLLNLQEEVTAQRGTIHGLIETLRQVERERDEGKQALAQAVESKREKVRRLKERHQHEISDQQAQLEEMRQELGKRERELQDMRSSCTHFAEIVDRVIHILDGIPADKRRELTREALWDVMSAIEAAIKLGSPSSLAGSSPGARHFPLYISPTSSIVSAGLRTDALRESYAFGRPHTGSRKSSRPLLRPASESGMATSDEISEHST